MKEKTNNRIGTNARGIVTPIIEAHDDLISIVTNSVLEAVGIDEIEDGDIVAVTEAVLAISQENFATAEQISKCISQLYGDTIAIVDPIQSRNRFKDILKAIAATPTLKKIYIFLTYPSDEVGNHLISEEELLEKGIGKEEVLSEEQFYEIFGKPSHPFTGVNYISEYKEACEGKAEIILCNDFSVIPAYCDEALVCSIHRRESTKRILRQYGMKVVHDLSNIMNESIDGSGYSPEYGLYGSNKMEGCLKLMPRDGQKFAEALQERFFVETGKKVETMVFGDGAFKDPVGKIWELADPTTTLGATDGLQGTPEEIKLKYVASQHRGKSKEEIKKAVIEAKAKRAEAGVSETASMGTTPRQITDLIASLCDLLVGSGDRCTPVAYLKGYLR